jgi:hypothetical protein
MKKKRQQVILIYLLIFRRQTHTHILYQMFFTFYYLDTNCLFVFDYFTTKNVPIIYCFYKFFFFLSLPLSIFPLLCLCIIYDTKKRASEKRRDSHKYNIKRMCDKLFIYIFCLIRVYKYRCICI